jgi:hypothetical protein
MMVLAAQHTELEVQSVAKFVTVQVGSEPPGKPEHRGPATFTTDPLAEKSNPPSLAAFDGLSEDVDRT